MTLGHVGRCSMLLVICCCLNAADKLFFVISMQVINLIQGPCSFPCTPLCVQVYLYLDYVQKKKKKLFLFVGQCRHFSVQVAIQ